MYVPRSCPMDAEFKLVTLLSFTSVVSPTPLCTQSTQETSSGLLVYTPHLRATPGN